MGRPDALGHPGSRIAWIVVALLVGAVMVQATTVINAVALAGSVGKARAAYPQERYFIDSEASAAWTATIVVLVVNLALGACLVVSARLLWLQRRRACPLAAVIAVLAGLCAPACVGFNPLNQQWDPDGHELVSWFFPTWHRPALAAAAGMAVVASIAALALLALPPEHSRYRPSTRAAARALARGPIASVPCGGLDNLGERTGRRRR